VEQRAGENGHDNDQSRKKIEVWAKNVNKSKDVRKRY
jgi:hypothetical protein